jgi:hypothetical protein
MPIVSANRPLGSAGPDARAPPPLARVLTVPWSKRVRVLVRLRRSVLPGAQTETLRVPVNRFLFLCGQEARPASFPTRKHPCDDQPPRRCDRTVRTERLFRRSRCNASTTNSGHEDFCIPLGRADRGVGRFFRFHLGHRFAASALMAPITKAFIGRWSGLPNKKQSPSAVREGPA